MSCEIKYKYSAKLLNPKTDNVFYHILEASSYSEAVQNILEIERKLDVVSLDCQPLKAGAK